MSKPKVFVTVLLSLMVIILILQNTEVVAIRVFFWEFEMSRVILMLLTTMAGFVCGYLVAKILEQNRRENLRNVAGGDNDL